EIKQRLVDRFASNPELRESIERAWVSTIDGFCARLLQSHAIAAGIAPDFRVLDQPSADRLARAAAEETLQKLYEERPAEMRVLLESVDLATRDAGRQADLAAALLDVCESMRLAAAGHGPALLAGASDCWPKARALAQRVLDAGLMRDWAAEFLAL